jgi:hypothetical protein
LRPPWSGTMVLIAQFSSSSVLPGPRANAGPAFLCRAPDRPRRPLARCVVASPGVAFARGVGALWWALPAVLLSIVRSMTSHRDPRACLARGDQTAWLRMQSATNQSPQTLNREINREFRRIRPSVAIFVSDQRADSIVYGRIPCGTEQGIFKCVSGNFFRGTGKFNLQINSSRSQGGATSLSPRRIQGHSAG